MPKSITTIKGFDFEQDLNQEEFDPINRAASVGPWQLLYEFEDLALES